MDAQERRERTAFAATATPRRAHRLACLTDDTSGVLLGGSGRNGLCSRLAASTPAEPATPLLLMLLLQGRPIRAV